MPPKPGWVYLDRLSQGVVTTAFDHHKDHDGKAFVVTGQVTLNNNGTVDLMVVTPDSSEWAHMLHLFRSTGEANLAITHTPTVTNVGTLLEYANRNQNSANVAATLVYQDPTLSAIGTALPYVAHFGSGQKEGGEERGNDEFVLKRDTTYVYRVTSEANGNDISWKMRWYEHDGVGDE